MGEVTGSKVRHMVWAQVTEDLKSPKGGSITCCGL